MNIPSSDLPRIVVIGGGFGGLHLVKKLFNSNRFQVVLIDKRNYHTFQPLLYQVSTSGLDAGSVAYPLRKFIKRRKDVYFRLAEINAIDAEQQTVYSDIGDLTYDKLIIATGSKTNFFGNDDIEQNGMRMKTIPQALNIRSLVLENLEEAAITNDKKRRKSLLNFVIAGAGPTGVELSGAISEVRKSIIPKDYPDLDPTEINIHLLEGMDHVLPPMSEEASVKAEKSLKKMGVYIHLNTMVNGYDGKTVTTNRDDLSFETATFIWSAGVTGAPVHGLNASALHEKANRYNVNMFNQIKGYQDIFAIGDIALMQSENYPKGHPMMAQPAIQQGKHLAKNLKRLQDKKELLPFKYKDKGSMATIGRNKAVVDLKNSSFGGFIAWFIWMFVHLWFLIGFRNRFVTFFNWINSYINYDRAESLIIRPFKLNRVKLEDQD